MYNVIIFTELTDNISAIKVMGAYKIAHVLRKNGYSCLVVDNFHAWTLQELKDLFAVTVSEHTRLIGFSNTFFANTNVEKNPDGSTPPYKPIWGDTICPQGPEFESEMLYHLRTSFPWIKTIVGGSKANPETRSRSIDFVSLGYSEYSIVNLMDHLVKGTELTHSYRNIWGKVVLDDRKGELYDFDASDMSWLPTDVVNGRVLPIEIGRGCVFRCKFCAYPMNGKKQLDFIRDADQIAQELQENYDRYGIYAYVIVDDTFNDNEWKLEQLHRAFKRLTFQPIFWAYVRLDLVSRDVARNIKMLYEIGLRAVHFGIETLNPATGKLIGKGHDRAKQIQALHYIQETYGYDLLTFGTFIVGLPLETEEMVTNTFEMLCDKRIPLHAWKFFPLMIAKPGRFSWTSEIDRDFAKFGYREVSNENDLVAGINWESDLMTFSRAKELAIQFNQKGHWLSEVYGLMVFEWMSLGFDFHELTKYKHHTLPFHEAETRKAKYVREYKLQLMDLLSKGVN